MIGSKYFQIFPNKNFTSDIKLYVIIEEYTVKWNLSYQKPETYTFVSRLIKTYFLPRIILICFTQGSRICGMCPPGYVGDGISCSFHGACGVNNGGCHHFAQCRDNPSNSTYK